MNIEERIQELRKNKGLSQEQLAEILGVSRQAVSKWESGQSLPELEKLVAMSELFETSTDFILKGTESRETTVMGRRRRNTTISAQTLSSVAFMLLVVGLVSAVAELSDSTGTMDIYAGLIIESVGVMLMLMSWFIAGGKAASKKLLTTNILIAGVLPSSLVSQLLLGLKPAPLPPLGVAPIFLFAVIYFVLCGGVVYLTLFRKNAK